MLWLGWCHSIFLLNVLQVVAELKLGKGCPFIVGDEGACSLSGEGSRSTVPTIFR